MVRVFKCVVVMMWASAAYSFHIEPELKPLLDTNKNSITLRFVSADGKTIRCRVVEVQKRNDEGLPVAFRQSWHYECIKCKKEKNACSCSAAMLPSIVSPSLGGNAEKNTDIRPYASIRVDEESSLVSPGLQGLTQGPNRFAQALAACVSLPQLLCAMCAADDEEVEINSCYEQYVAPFELPLEHHENCCCNCMFTFCPCCMPQKEI